MLDQVNARVVGFDAKEPGARTRSLALPEGVEPTDLIVVKSSIYVWDGKPISRLGTSERPRVRGCNLAA